MAGALKRFDIPPFVLWTEAYKESLIDMSSMCLWATNESPILNCYGFRAHLDFFISRKIHGCARVRIVNGTSTPLLDTRAVHYLSQQCLAVREFRDTPDPTRTTIILYSPKLYTLRYRIDICEITNRTPSRIHPAPSQTVDIEIRLATDWVSKLPSG